MMESSNNDKLSFGKTADDEIPNTNANNTDGNDGFFFPALPIQSDDDHHQNEVHKRTDTHSASSSRNSAHSCEYGSMNASDKHLFKSIEEVQEAIDLFFDNKFIEAKELTAQKAETSMYHAIGYSTLLFLEAVMTFETEDINKALESVASSVQVCTLHRRKKSITQTVVHALGLSSQSEMTEVEKHAELIFAELNLYRAFLTFVQDENLISFIRGALKIRTCYQTYNSCLKIAEKLQPTPYNMQFIGGVYVGCGFFNICLSLLPPRILSLLEWIGFTTNKEKGKEQLMQAYNITNLRSSLVAIYILCYNFFLTVHLGTHDADLKLALQVLNVMFKKYPSGIFFHLFAGRMEQLKGNFDTAIVYLEKAKSLQSQWKQFAHLCYWELMWCHAFKMEWNRSAEYAELLRQESNWSKCIYTYLTGIFLFMSNQQQSNIQIKNLMNSVPKLMQRFAGKSLPTEKFITRKSRKFLESGCSLFLPAHEMLYSWNGLVFLKENTELRSKHLQMFNDEAEKLEERKQAADSTSISAFDYYDDFCLLQLLKGTLYHFNKEEMKAETCFLDIKEKYSQVKKDHYLAPAALSDLAWLMIEQERYEEANNLLKFIRKTYSHYSLESRIHFRIHAAQCRLDEILGEMASTTS